MSISNCNECLYVFGIITFFVLILSLPNVLSGDIPPRQVREDEAAQEHETSVEEYTMSPILKGPSNGSNNYCQGIPETYCEQPAGLEDGLHGGGSLGVGKL